MDLMCLDVLPPSGLFDSLLEDGLLGSRSADGLLGSRPLELLSSAAIGIAFTIEGMDTTLLKSSYNISWSEGLQPSHRK